MSKAIILEGGERKEYDRVGIEEGFAIGETRHATFEHPGMDHYYEAECYPMTRVERVEGLK